MGSDVTLAGTVRQIAGRRWRWLTALALAAFTAGLWLALVAAGTAALVVVD